MLVHALSVLNGWGIYRPQTSSNFELKTVNSRNSGIWQLHRLTGTVAPPGRVRRLSLWAVPPPVRGGCTAQSRSETKPRWCHCLAGAVAPPSLARRLSPGGATSWLGWLHLSQPLGSEWVDPFGPIWVFQGPNCPKIKLMGSPPIFQLNQRANYD